MEFWQDQASSMPNIAVVAMWVLGIPGSTAALERLFSAAGRGVNSRRPRLLPKLASKLIFGHANVVFGYTGAIIRQRRLSGQSLTA